jgi:hypothetical protein
MSQYERKKFVPVRELVAEQARFCRWHERTERGGFCEVFRHSSDYLNGCKFWELVRDGRCRIEYAQEVERRRKQNAAK